MGVIHFYSENIYLYDIWLFDANGVAIHNVVLKADGESRYGRGFFSVILETKLVVEGINDVLDDIKG